MAVCNYISSSRAGRVLWGARTFLRMSKELERMSLSLCCLPKKRGRQFIRLTNWFSRLSSSWIVNFSQEFWLSL
ncbi:hypothetical protein DERF_006924 [Dermatophagoides farinae]|uniref:Uncharacterized protein n=1 Tax=Dermatophagoides farinae TaxID=6954 RepID=A0A922HZH6_DERFA|nr:hypothetical protein DERF_006924 [Dermatophagoides farinae]